MMSFGAGAALTSGLIPASSHPIKTSSHVSTTKSPPLFFFDEYVVTSPRKLFSVLEQTRSGHFLFIFNASSTPSSLWEAVGGGGPIFPAP